MDIKYVDIDMWKKISLLVLRYWSIHSSMGREGNKIQSKGGSIVILASLEKHLISVFESLSKYSYNLYPLLQLITILYVPLRCGFEIMNSSDFLNTDSYYNKIQCYKQSISIIKS